MRRRRGEGRMFPRRVENVSSKKKASDCEDADAEDGGVRDKLVLLAKG
jgi:hypothetical protein